MYLYSDGSLNEKVSETDHCHTEPSDSVVISEFLSWLWLQTLKTKSKIIYNLIFSAGHPVPHACGVQMPWGVWLL